MTTKPAKPRKDRAPLNLTMGWVGLVGIAGALTGRIMDTDAAWPTVLAFVVLISMLVMFWTRKSDEYTFSLWSSAVNAGFVITLAWTFFGPAFEGFFDGLTGNESGMDWPFEYGAFVGILGFYVTFNVKRLTGAF